MTAVTLYSPDGVQSATFDARLDPGFPYCLVPASILLRLGIDPEREIAFHPPGAQAPPPAGGEGRAVRSAGFSPHVEQAPPPAGAAGHIARGLVPHSPVRPPPAAPLAVLPAARARLEANGRRTTLWCLFAEEDVRPVLGLREP